MRAVIPIVFGLLTLTVLPGAAKAGDAEGCADLKQLPRLEGCIIQECSAKQHESFDTMDGSSGSLEANVNTLTYSCPVSLNIERVKRELDAEIRKAGYQNVAEDKTDPANSVVTARKGSHWLRWGASSEDGATSYLFIRAESAAEKFKAEACSAPPVFSLQKTCEIVECASKSEDSAGMRTAQNEQTSIAGAIETATLVCPATPPAQMLSAAEEELTRSGFEVLFRDREHPESGWVTGRAGQRWVELVSVPDGESVSYALTVVPSAEVLTASKQEPRPVAVATPVPAPAPKPVQIAAETVTPSAPVSAPAATPIPPTPPVAASAPVAKFEPPVPILQVPIEPTHDRVYSVTGNVVINLLVSVNEQGAVTEAVLTGHITKDVLKLESAAIDAVWHWRFEPARQDGRIVAAVKIPVQMRFHGRPWRF